MTHEARPDDDTDGRREVKGGAGASTLWGSHPICPLSATSVRRDHPSRRIKDVHVSQSVKDTSRWGLARVHAIWQPSGIGSAARWRRREGLHAYEQPPSECVRRQQVIACCIVGCWAPGLSLLLLIIAHPTRLWSRLLEIRPSCPV